tara:strand:- start:936 stop:1838 length:903 start_codon:yes stop_codon:yes gene_type:complete
MNFISFALVFIISFNVYAGIGTHCLRTLRIASNKSIEIRKHERNELIAHHAITTDLYHGQVVSWRSFSENNNKNSIFELKIYNSRTQRIRTVLFKPRFRGDGHGWNRVPMEYVAYEIGRMINTDLIPPAAYKRNITLGEHHFYEGAFLYKVPDTHPLGRVNHRVWDLEFNYQKLDKDLFLSDARIIDVLLQNPDRHINNFMRGRHWVDGVYRPFLIDHAASLKKGFNITLEQNDAFKNGEITVFRRTTVEGLRGLNIANLRQLGEFLSEAEIQKINQRKEEILLYIDKLIAQKGEAKVVF